MIKLQNEYILLKEKEINLIAGKPGVGKTRFVVNEVKNASYEHKVLYISCENSRAKLYEKYNLNTSDNLIISDSFELEYIVNKIKDVKPEYVYIDYLELVKGDELFTELRNLCNELNIAVLVISMANSKSDYSEYKTDRFDEVDNLMIMNDESIISLD